MALMQPKRLLLYPLLMVTGLSCGPSALEPLPLEADFTATPNPAAVAQEVTFVVEAQGTNLRSLEIDFGDGEDDSRNVDGSRTARWSQPHTFAAPGQYTVTARINELVDTASRTITMTINPAASAANSIPRVFVVK
jgi:PKD repeat protein